MSTGGIDLTEALRCARLAIRLYQGRPVPPRLAQHLNHLETLTAGSVPATDSVAGQTESEELIGTTEAARILGCSTSYVRRIHTDLDGRQITKHGWLFDRSKVEQYAQQRDQYRGRPDLAG